MSDFCAQIIIPDFACHMRDMKVLCFYNRERRELCFPGGEGDRHLARDFKAVIRGVLKKNLRVGEIDCRLFYQEVTEEHALYFLVARDVAAVQEILGKDISSATLNGSSGSYCWIALRGVGLALSTELLPAFGAFLSYMAVDRSFGTQFKREFAGLLRTYPEPADLGIYPHR